MKSTFASAVFSVGLTLAASATTNIWVGGVSGAWNDAANWEDADDSSVHAVPSNGNDTALFPAGDDVTVTCDGWLEPAVTLNCNIIFSVAEGKTAYLKGKQSGTATLTKTGPGTLDIRGGSSRSGWTYVNEGTLAFSGDNVLGANGGCLVGDGIHDAVLQPNRDYSWGTKMFGPGEGKGDLIITNKGVVAFDLSNNNVNLTSVSNIRVEKGGILRMGSHGFQNSYSLGQHVFIGDYTALPSSSFRATSSTLYVPNGRTNTYAMPFGNMTVQFQWSNSALYAKLKADGGDGLKVDMHIDATISSAWDARDGLDILGPGTVKLSGNNSTYGGTNSQGYTRVLGGTLLVDNTEGSGTGYSKVFVSAGATLGGIGTIGGMTEGLSWSNRGGNAYPSNQCVIVNGAAGNPGVLAPGSWADNTNERIYGTLTVRSAEQAALAAQGVAMKMGDNSKLDFEIGESGYTALKVYGPMTLGKNVTLNITAADSAPSGWYTLAEATEGLSGSFTLTGNVKASHVEQTADKIRVFVTGPGMSLFVR